MLAAFAYIGLLAIPFVPAAEIGIAILTTSGPTIAPLVYTSTVLAMLLSCGVGRLVPAKAIVRLLTLLRMRRTAALVARIAPLPGEVQHSVLLEGAPLQTVALALRHRYVPLALALNLPGHAVIGGAAASWGWPD